MSAGCYEVKERYGSFKGKCFIPLARKCGNYAHLGVDAAGRVCSPLALGRMAFTYPETTLHEQFFAQAARTPARVAVIDGDRELTYATLASLEPGSSGVVKGESEAERGEESVLR